MIKLVVTFENQINNLYFNLFAQIRTIHCIFEKFLFVFIRYTAIKNTIIYKNFECFDNGPFLDVREESLYICL